MNISLYLVEFCRLFLFAVLFLSAVGKIRTFSSFGKNLAQSFKVPVSWTAPLTALLIAAEGGLSLLILLNNDLTYLAVCGALFMFAGFTAFIAYTVIQEKLVRCNCFGQSEEYISYLDIIRNVVLLLACGFFLYSYQPAAIALPIQVLLFFMAFSAFLVVTNLKNIAVIAKDPTGS